MTQYDDPTRLGGQSPQGFESLSIRGLQGKRLLLREDHAGRTDGAFSLGWQGHESVAWQEALPWSIRRGRKGDAFRFSFEGKRLGGFPLRLHGGFFHDAFDPGAQGRGRQSTNLLVDGFPVDESEQHGDASNLKFARCLGIFVDIDLCDQNVMGHFACEFFQSGSNHAAGTAPWCPEVHDDWDRRCFDGFLEVGIRQGDGASSQRQDRTALATLWLAFEPSQRNSVDRLTLLTLDGR